MHCCNIAMSFNLKSYFDENSTWQVNLFKRRPIMQVPKEYWILMGLYIAFWWCISYIVIMVFVKLL